MNITQEQQISSYSDNSKQTVELRLKEFGNLVVGYNDTFKQLKEAHELLQSAYKLLCAKGVVHDIVSDIHDYLEENNLLK